MTVQFDDSLDDHVRRKLRNYFGNHNLTDGQLAKRLSRMSLVELSRVPQIGATSIMHIRIWLRVRGMSFDHDQQEKPLRQTKSNASALLGAAIQRDNRAMRKAIVFALATSNDSIEVGDVIITAKQGRFNVGYGDVVLKGAAVAALRKAAKL